MISPSLNLRSAAGLVDRPTSLSPSHSGNLVPSNMFSVSKLMEGNMDWNRVEGNWKQVKGKIKEQWGKLTDDDLDVING
jgi:CsbD-like protein